MKNSIVFLILTINLHEQLSMHYRMRKLCMYLKLVFFLAFWLLVLGSSGISKVLPMGWIWTAEPYHLAPSANCRSQ